MPQPIKKKQQPGNHPPIALRPTLEPISRFIDLGEAELSLS